MVVLYVRMFVVFFALVLSGCSSGSLSSSVDAAAVDFGLRERVVVPVAVDVVLDATVDAPGRVVTWESTLGVVLPVVLSSNGLLRSWVVTPVGVVRVAGFVQ